MRSPRVRLRSFANAKFRILPPQPASPVSTGQHVNAPQNDAVPRHFADTARSPCRELGYIVGIQQRKFLTDRADGSSLRAEKFALLDQRMMIAQNNRVGVRGSAVE